MQTAEVGHQVYRPNNAEKGASDSRVHKHTTPTNLENTEGKNITRLFSSDRPMIKGANHMPLLASDANPF